MIPKAFLPLLLAASSLVGLARANDDHVDGVAAVVDGEVITFLHVRRELDRFRRAAPAEFARLDREKGRIGLYRYALDILVENELLFAEVKERQIKLPRDYVDARLQAIVHAEAGGDWKRFSGMLLDAGRDMKEFRADLEKRLAAEVLVDELVRRAVAVTPREVDAYYQQNRQQLVRPERVHLQLIYLARGAGETDADLDAREAELRRKLAAGEDFAALARALSNDSTAAQGGELGWQETTDLSDLYREAIRNVPSGQLAKTIREPRGLHLLKVTGHEAAVQLELDDQLRPRIETMVRMAKEKAQYDRLLAELRQKFYLKNFIAEDADRR